MSLASERKTPIDGNPDPMDLVEEPSLMEIGDEDVACTHWADRMRRRRANANREQIKRRDDGMLVIGFTVSARFSIFTALGARAFVAERPGTLQL
jgi:hypothetical protein